MDGNPFTLGGLSLMPFDGDGGGPPPYPRVGLTLPHPPPPPPLSVFTAQGSEAAREEDGLARLCFQADSVKLMDNSNGRAGCQKLPGAFAWRN